MTDVTENRGQAEAELSAADEQLLRELTERARTGGLRLTGEGGLLGRLTNSQTPMRSSTSRMVMPSTPGVFAPRLPSTRQYATYSVRDRDHLPGRNGAAADAASHRAGPRAVTGAGRWRVLRAVHDRGKIIADLAVAVALGGDLLADIAMLRSQPELTGPVASDPVSRLVTALAEDSLQGALDDSRGAGRGLGAGLTAGRGRHARHGRRAGHCRSGRDAGDRVLRGGARLARRAAAGSAMRVVVFIGRKP